MLTANAYVSGYKLFGSLLLSMFYKKGLSSTVLPVVESPNYCLYKFGQRCKAFSLVSVCMRRDQRDFQFDIEDQNILGEFECTLESTESSKSLFACDSNINGCENNRRWDADENILAFRDLELPAGSFTYLSPSDHTTSWIDHFLTSTCVFVCKVIALCSMSFYDPFHSSFDFEVP